MNTQFQESKTNLSSKSLLELLDQITVLSPGMWENDDFVTIENWYAVTSDSGIIAYFNEKSDACRFRLDYINRLLND